jgi:transglycosylase-like protein with SLT domain
MSIRRSCRAAAGPRSAAARLRAGARPRASILVAALLAVCALGPAAAADAAVTGGRSVPSGSAAADHPGGDRGSTGSGHSDAGSSGGSARNRSTGGFSVPPPGARRTDGRGEGRADGPGNDRKDDGKKDDGKKGSGTGDDKGGRKDDGKKPDDRPADPKPPRTGDDDRPGPGASDIPSRYLALYEAAAAAADVSWRLIAAVGKNESDHGRSNLPGVRSGVNSAGCCSGPMQLCTVKSCGNTWDAYKRDGNGDGVTNVYEAADSIHAAAALLADLQRMFGKHPGLILAGYNAGAGNVQRHKGVPPYPETQAYVKRGLDYMHTLGP